MEPVRRKLLAEAQPFLARFQPGSDSSPAVRWRAARARVSLGTIEELLGNHAEAERAYEQGIAALEQLAGEFPTTSEYHQALARAHASHGVLLKKDNRFAEAEAELRRALKIMKPLAARSPGAADREAIRYQLATVLARLGQRDEEAEAAYRRALARQREQVARSPATLTYQEQLARTCNNLGVLLQVSARDEAEKLCREAVGILEKMPAAAGTRWQLARGHNNLANLLKAQDPATAEASYRTGRSQLTQLWADFPAVPDYARELADVELNLGMILEERDHRPQAEEQYRHALALLAGLVEQFPGVPDYQYRLATVRYNLGILLSETKRPKEAEECYRQARDGQQTLLERFPSVPDYQSNMGAILANWAVLLWQRGQLAEAREHTEQAIGHHESALAASPRNRQYGDFLRTEYQQLAIILVKLDDAAAAVRALRTAVDKKYIRKQRDLELRDFDPLRQRDDFKSLLRELPDNGKPAVG
jgi:tetratricopeptide (TPR) repeat protein